MSVFSNFNNDATHNLEFSHGTYSLVSPKGVGHRAFIHAFFLTALDQINARTTHTHHQTAVTAHRATVVDGYSHVLQGRRTDDVGACGAGKWCDASYNKYGMNQARLGSKEDA